MEAGLAAPSQLTVLLVHSSKYFVYKYAHVLVSYCAQIPPVPNLSTTQVCMLPSGWQRASLLRPTSPCCLYVAANIFYTITLMSLFLISPGCAQIVHVL